MTNRNHVWIDGSRVFEARPIVDVINDGASQPDNPQVRWVVFQVFTRPGPDLDYDACGYARTLGDARRGKYIS